MQAVDLRFPEGAIWLTGPNGAGKTSLLEAVYVLSRGSSFRGRRHGPLTSRGLASTRLEARLRDGDHAWERRWSSVDRRQTQVTGAGFLVRLVGSSMHALLEDDPTLRRRFVDWNLFHVEPRFSGLRQRYRRIAAQRNAWLKGGGTGRAVWDHEYAALLTQVAEFRHGFVAALASAFVSIGAEFPAMTGLSLIWRSGLPQDVAVRDWLLEHRDADIARGYSFLSPARADFHFMKEGSPWVGSRGQNKLAGILLQLAADQVISDALGGRAVWLIDDLAAEMDLRTQSEVLALIYAAADQLLVASLTEPPADLAKCCRAKVFHVEQGKIHAHASA